MAALVAALLSGCAGEGGRGGESRGERKGERPAATAAAPPPTRVPNDATPTRVDIGGYSLAVRCSGKGRPAVVLEAGYGLSSARWRKTQREVEKGNRVCSYDREGIGRSDERPSEASERTTSDELHALLTRIGFPPPYVLAGHSAGGAYIVEYANAYPDHVLGLVLVDAVPPGRLPPELSDAPLVVLEAGRGATGGWSGIQAQSAELSRNSVHAVALRSGHHIQASQPLVVARAIRAAARSGETGSRLPACAELFAGLAVACPAGE